MSLAPKDHRSQGRQLVLRFAALQLAGTLVAAAVAGWLAGVPAARAEQGFDPDELASALMYVPMKLQDGLVASGAQGRPISGKYEIEDGQLQLPAANTQG